MIALSFGLDMHEAIWLSNMINIFVVEHFRFLFFVFRDADFLYPHYVTKSLVYYSRSNEEY